MAAMCFGYTGIVDFLEPAKAQPYYKRIGQHYEEANNRSASMIMTSAQTHHLLTLCCCGSEVMWGTMSFQRKMLALAYTGRRLSATCCVPVHHWMQWKCGWGQVCFETASIVQTTIKALIIPHFPVGCTSHHGIAVVCCSQSSLQGCKLLS